MWSFGRYHLKLSEKDFWGLTLAQFDSLAKQYTKEQEMLNYRVALVCSIIAEVNRNPKKRKRPFTPDDFMPKKRKQAKLTDGEMMDQIRAINIALGGEAK